MVGMPFAAFISLSLSIYSAENILRLLSAIQAVFFLFIAVAYYLDKDKFLDDKNAKSIPVNAKNTLYAIWFVISSLIFAEVYFVSINILSIPYVIILMTVQIALGISSIATIKRESIA